ncbi:MAG TPA: HAMP domain-containing sensor histidine kinase [Candidatus Dormibacteraeota bacterium]|nr:HAMP domain-containing sensor histidine kinase [Candidatus Dormibacteraeota bacterium]
MRAGGGRGRWQGWVETSDPDAPPRRRPPWWPEGEPFPPAWRRGRHGPPQFIRLIGCLFLGALLVAAVFGAGVGAIFGRFGFHPLVLIPILFVALLVVAATSGIRRVTRPVDNLTQAARKIEAGDYSAQVPEWGPPEIRSVARAFNSMSARLKTIDEQRRGFLADVTHELRTPLSVIRGQAEGIADGLYPGDAAHIAPIVDAALTLERLVEDLRTLALADAGNLVLNREPTDVGALVRDVVESFRSQADSGGVTLTADIAGQLPTLDLDPARMRGAIANLLSNAIRHTPAGGSVNATVSPAAGQVTIKVSDDGEGIPADLLPHVFERFARGPESKGSGLGLAIAHDIVNAHSGTLTIDSVSGSGTTATINLPNLQGAAGDR